MRYRRFVPVLFLALSMPVFAGNSSSGAKYPAKVSLPQRKTVSIPSPNGRWNLVATPVRSESDRQLFLVNRSSGERSLIKTYQRDLTVGWGPDSHAFFLNDGLGSNIEEAYIHWISKDQPLLLDDLILRSDPEARALNADHTYFHVYRWRNAHSVDVEYCGHTSETPVRQFYFLYRVDLSGSNGTDADIHRFQGKVSPATTLDCLHS